jgi:hypothetical protein
MKTIKSSNLFHLFKKLLWMEKTVVFWKTVPMGEAEPWTTLGRIIVGESKPTKKVIHHWLDWRAVLSTAPAQKGCGPYWPNTGTQLRMIS